MSTPKIHPSAIIDPCAQIDASAQIGPYCVIGKDVSIGADCVLHSHIVVDGPTEIGARTRIWPFASIGAAPQDKKFKDEPTQLIIGCDNTIRESVTINRGTVQGGGITRIGDDNWIMAYVHIAHDCIVGNHTIFANNATLAGHVTIEDWVILGGATLVHQFCRVGAHAFTGMAAKINGDVPPFVVIAGEMSAPRGINSEGLKRRGFSSEQIMAIKRAYKTLYQSDLSLADARAKLAETAAHDPHIAQLLSYLAQSERGIQR
jgi:UDP-N-acetylglucosamine acyltransferase